MLPSVRVHISEDTSIFLKYDSFFAIKDMVLMILTKGNSTYLVIFELVSEADFVECLNSVFCCCQSSEDC